MKEAGRIYCGEVVHKRLTPVEHRLNYNVYSFFVDVDRLDEIDRTNKWFSLDRFNLFSIKQRDHGFRDHRSMSQFAWTIVERCGLKQQVSSIGVLLYPRLLGFAFNPLTVYFCMDAEGKPLLMIYDVRNTFSENFVYVLEAGRGKDDVFTHGAGKQFYVSTFNHIEGDYQFHVRKPGNAITVGVALRVDNKPILRTHFSGKAKPVSDKTLFPLFFSYPLMTLKVVAGINWEAAKLWIKGLRYSGHKPAPTPNLVLPDGTLADLS